MSKIGVIEIFFGQPWPKLARLAYARFLRSSHFDFYLYGPKADAHLRKQWTHAWPVQYLNDLTELAENYKNNGIKFGVVLSPFGLHEEIKAGSESLLKEKIQCLSAIGIDMLGIFFDDMPNVPALAARQVEVLKMVQSLTSVPLVFCPTFYSHDPILDRVFGERSSGYLQEIGESVPKNIDILWTGPQVISEEISDSHLVDVSRVLRRKPFVCDNRFANDGPKNCKFIKLKNPSGLTLRSLQHASHWAFNPMNQSELSKIVLLAAIRALQRDEQSQNYLEMAHQLCSKNFAKWLEQHGEVLLKSGLDGIPNEDTKAMISSLQKFPDPAATELIDWLDGKYIVGNECLTD